MNKFKNWLFKPYLDIHNQICLIFAGAFICILSVVPTSWFFNTFSEEHMGGAPVTGIFSFLSMCILAPLWEEVAFRFMPLLLARKLGKEFIIPTIFFTSVIFGVLHDLGNYGILVQGIYGVVLSIVFIKNNYSIVSSIFVHFLINFSFGALLPYVVNG